MCWPFFVGIDPVNPPRSWHGSPPLSLQVGMNQVPTSTFRSFFDPDCSHPNTALSKEPPQEHPGSSLMTSPITYLTPPQYAKRLGVKPDTVVGWIRSGELRAINVARRDAKRPRYRISLDSVIAFENGRAASATTSKPTKRRKQQTDVITFF
jgi:excisionase family DNA binding protein